MDHLQGLRVVDVTQNLAGPYCTQILGDLGADVVKIEPPTGDSARAWGPPFWNSESPLFLSVNRNKRSVRIDLKNERGREIAWTLIDHADVFVQSLRAGVVESLGFDYESVEARRPEIIYVSVTAYGQAGPLKNLPGYDPLMQAQSGIMSVTGHPETGPARVGVSVVDFGTGMWAAVGALAALHERAKTGRGCHVTTALLDTALGWISYHVIGHWASGVVPEPMGSQFGMIAPYGAFPTEDGQLMIAAGNDASFGRLCIALGLRELVDDPRYSSNPSRVENRDDLFRVVARVTHRHTTSGLLEPPRTTCRSCGAHPRRGRSRCRTRRFKRRACSVVSTIQGSPIIRTWLSPFAGTTSERDLKEHRRKRESTHERSWPSSATGLTRSTTSSRRGW